MSDQDEISIKELIAIIKNWWLYIITKTKYIFLCIILFSFLGMIYSLLNKPKYNATLTFALEEKNAGGALGAYSGIASQFGIDIGSNGNGGAFSGENILELMKSRLILEKTLLAEVEINNSKTNLLERYIEFNEYRKAWLKKIDLKNIEFIKTTKKDFTIKHDSIISNVIKDIKSNYLTVSKVDKKLNIVSVTINSKDELFAKLFAEELVRNVSEFYIETKTKKSRTNVQLLQNRTDSVKLALDREMYGAAINQDQNQNIIQAKAKVPGVKKQMNIQMLGTMYTELVKNLEFSKLALMREEPLIQIIDTPVLPLHKTKFGKLKGIIFGGLIGFFISIVFFTIKRGFINLIK